MTTARKFVAVLADGTRLTMISMEPITNAEAIRCMQARFNQKVKLETNDDNTKRKPERPPAARSRGV
jgi:hypothetical protein